MSGFSLFKIFFILLCLYLFTFSVGLFFMEVGGGVFKCMDYDGAKIQRYQHSNTYQITCVGYFVEGEVEKTLDVKKAYFPLPRYVEVDE